MESTVEDVPSNIGDNDCVPSTSTVSSVASLITATQLMPDCWFEKQCVKFKNDYDWLLVHEGKLGCVVCRQVAELPNTKLQLSSEWCDGKVGPCGNKRDTRQSSLRKKMYEHNKSAAHKSAQKQLEIIQNDELVSAVKTQNLPEFDETCRVFRTAYYIAKQDRPYSDHSDLITLQQLNGLDMDRILHSKTTCTDIIDHIASELRHNLLASLLSQKRCFAVLIDESTSLSRLSCLIVYIRTVLCHDAGPVTFFLDIVELSQTISDGIVSALNQCLTAHGFTDVFLAECWVGIGVDGASVMLGSKSGVVTKFKSLFPRLTSFHCFNHRLELSVSDAVKSCSAVNYFKIFMDALYSLYSQSPKCQRELADCAAEVDVQLNRIGRVFDVRWVSSSCRAVKVVWRCYYALYCHFLPKGDRSVARRKRTSKILRPG